VKALELVADPREVAVLSAKPNFRALGPRFGKGAPTAAQRITAMTPAEIMTLREEGSVTLDLPDGPAPFGFEEVQILEEGVAPWVAAGAQGLTVALDTTLTDELRAEGLAREIINKVQNLRKKSGLAVSDRIRLDISGPAEALAAVRLHKERICGETLALDVAAQGELTYKESLEIDGHRIDIALQRV